MIESDKIKSSENLGRLTASLKLEEEVINNGILPKKSLAEKVSFVKGLIDHFVDNGDFVEAISLVTKKDSSVRLLYDGNLDELYTKAVSSIKRDDFKLYEDGSIDTSCRGINIFNSLPDNKKDLIFEYIFNKNLDYKTSSEIFALYSLSEKIPKNKLNEYYYKIANQEKSEYPGLSFILFKKINDKKSAEYLYKELSDNFSLKNLELLLDFTNNFEYGKKKIEKENIIRKTLSFENIPENIGKLIYYIINSESILIASEQRDRINDIVAKNMESYEIDKGKHPDLELKWAKFNFRKDPELAYKLFLEHNYNGNEIIDCAEIIVDRIVNINNVSERMNVNNFKKEHLEKVYSKSKHIKVREFLAKNLDDKVELKRLSNIYLKYNPEHAYHLIVDSGDANEENKVFMDLVSRFTKDTIKKAQSNLGSFISCSWLDYKDNVGYKFVFNNILDFYTKKAYELALDWKDLESVSKAREVLLSKASPEDNLKFFKYKKDEIGYNKVLNLLSEKYSLPVDDVKSLVDIKK